jgi:hypothetical protein
MRAALPPFLLAGACALVITACSPDLHETAGPVIPYPNLTGSVMRDSIPVQNMKVKLQVIDTDSAYAVDRTDGRGRYGFSDIAAGSWTVKVTSADPRDFAGVTYTFTFPQDRPSFEVPALDMSLDGLSPSEPADSATVPVAGFSDPMTFSWSPPRKEVWTVQVRLYDASGDPVWFSDKRQSDSIVWNGIGNQGTHLNRPTLPGAYQWRLRMIGLDPALEYSSGYRWVTLQERTR